MTALGNLHWLIAVFLGAALIWNELRGKVMSKKPLAVTALLLFVGVALAYGEDPSIQLNISNVLLFRTINFGSIAIAIAYSFLVLWIAKILKFWKGDET